MSGKLDHLPKGRAWEFRLHRALFASGWYVRRGVNLAERVSGSPQTMAEVDLLGLSFDAALGPARLIGECKDRKGNTKEADRVVWLMGLAQIVPARHLVFAKPRIAPATHQFASSTNVALWDEAQVQAVEHEAQLGDDWWGAFDPELHEQVLLPATHRDVLSDIRLREAHGWITNAFWYQGTPARVKQLATYMDTVVKLSKPSSDTRRVLIAEGILGLLAAALTTAGQLNQASPALAVARQRERIASGAASSGALRELAARADDYYQDVIARIGRQSDSPRQAPTVPRLVEHIAGPPPWTDSYLALARRLARLPHLATEVLRFAELVLLEGHVGRRDVGPAIEQHVSGASSYARAALGLAAAFCSRVWNIEDETLAELMTGNGERAQSVASDDRDRSASGTSAAAERRGLDQRDSVESSAALEVTEAVAAQPASTDDDDPSLFPTP